MSDAIGVGYLAQAEANRIAIRPGPSVVYLRLIRDFRSENQVTAMFSELTPNHAMQLIRELQAAVRIALSSAGLSQVE